MKTLFISFAMTLALTVLTGAAYPFLTTVFAQAVFPSAAAGGLVRIGDQVVGAQLIGQRFSSPGYFQGRPSAAGTDGYDGLASGGSNFAVTAQKLKDRISADFERLRKENPDAAAVPAELVLASGSGLDPQLSPAAAYWQAARVASARHVDPGRITRVIEALAEGPDLGVFGRARVNVLALNLALDRQFGAPPLSPSSAPLAPSGNTDQKK